MREILFRGKRVDNGEWVYGYYCHVGYAGSEKHYIVSTYATAFYVVEIVPETVGQYTDLNDKNDRKIFRGDIIKITNDKRDAREFDINIGIGLVEFFDGFWCISGQINNSLYDIKNICQNILLHVTKENVPAYNLYKKLNFITTSEIIYYDNL